MSVYVEYLKRPVSAAVHARLVCDEAGAHGDSELENLLAAVGLQHVSRGRGTSGRAYVYITPNAILRAMHAGAIPVEAAQIHDLIHRVPLPRELLEYSSETRIPAVS